MHDIGTKGSRVSGQSAWRSPDSGKRRICVRSAEAIKSRERGARRGMAAMKRF